MDQLKVNRKSEFKSCEIDCEEVTGAKRCEVEEKQAKKPMNGDDDDGDLKSKIVMRNVSQSLNQNNQKFTENQQKPRSSQLKIDISSCPANEEDNSQIFSRLSPVKKLNETNRRAKIFDSCKVKSPSLFLAEGNMANSTTYYPSLTETLEEMKKESEDKFSSMKNQQSTVPGSFQFPHRPIEQITLLNSEVELERQSSKRKQTLKSHASADSVKDSFLNEDVPNAAKRRALSPPEFDKLNFEGENVSGVLNLS